MRVVWHVALVHWDNRNCTVLDNCNVSGNIAVIDALIAKLVAKEW